MSVFTIKNSHVKFKLKLSNVYTKINKRNYVAILPLECALNEYRLLTLKYE